MRRLLRRLGAPFMVPARHHFWGALAIVLFTCSVVVAQVGDRRDFAGGELRKDVMARWGAPIDQPAPSARYVESGAVFSALEKLPFDSQRLRLDATMSWRKRGLVDFSGFEFGFKGHYRLTNPKAKAIDAVFVFPLQAEQNRILLSDLAFSVDGAPEAIPLHSNRDKLVWTGRIEPNATVTFEIRLHGQGLDRFRYVLDPGLSARNVDLSVRVEGGDNFDYPPGVVPAHRVARSGGQVELSWHFDALESGVPVGLLLPSQTSFDAVILTMTRRAWAPFAVLFVVVVLLARLGGQRMARHDAYFLAAVYSFFFVLLPYLAAYMHFWWAYLLSLLVIGGLLNACLQRITAAARRVCVAVIAALLLVPSAAAVFEQHTGLIYCLEILAALAVLSALMARPRFRELVDELTTPAPSSPTGERHAQA